MTWPLSQDYNEAIQDPSTSFGDPELRGGEAFVKEVDQNAVQADKYLSIGKTPGSLTGRGKMMILLGPAAPTAITKKKTAGEVHNDPGNNQLCDGVAII